MDNNLYIIILVGLTIFIISYGGHNQQNNIEYNTSYFNNLNIINIYENKINKISKNILSDKINFVNINKYIITCDITLPNFINSFFILIKAYNYFNIYNIIDITKIKTHMMIIFNYNMNSDLELLIKKDENIGYFYDLEKKISITGIYHLYNNSSNDIIITCFIIKKPFWYN